MNEPFGAVKISDHVYWVGAVDWTIKDFHGYATDRGTTYNAYLVLADRITLIDTVKAPFREEMLARVSSVIEPDRISYIVSNHAEMDHSGGLPWTIERTKPDKLFASAKGAKALSEHLRLPKEITAVKEGETVSLGNLSLSFLETPMLHWPESMFTILPEEKLLFSQDGFGMHLASTERFVDEISDEILYDEAAKYFANILMPYSAMVLKLLEKVNREGIDFGVIAPDHGPVWRRDKEKILQSYEKWSRQKPADKAVIVYDTMWESTALMARVIVEGLSSAGTEVKLMPLSSSHRSDVATELLDAGALLVGSPTLNNTMFPTLADVLTYLKGLKPKNLIGAVFGSYGWSGEATRHIGDFLSAMGIETVGEAKARYVPSGDALSRCYALGREVGERLKDFVKAF